MLENWQYSRIRHAPKLTAEMKAADPLAELKWKLLDEETVRKSKDSANRVFTSLKAALNRAFADVDNGVQSDHAWRLVKPFRDVGSAREVFLDQNQCKRLINACPPALRNLVTIAIISGARPPGELREVRVSRFRKDLKILSVNGKNGPRDVVLSQEATDFLARISEGKQPDDLLFPNEDGGEWTKSLHSRPMAKAVKAAGLTEHVTIYCLRHTYASQTILNRMNLALLAENMGTSIAMLEKHYSHFIAQTKTDLIEETSFKLGLTAPNESEPLTSLDQLRKLTVDTLSSYWGGEQLRPFWVDASQPIAGIVV